LDHVVHQSAGGTGHGASLLITIASDETQLASFFGNFNRRVNVQFESALAPFTESCWPANLTSTPLAA
jgi:hypothetical protein